MEERKEKLVKYYTKSCGAMTFNHFVLELHCNVLY